MTDKDIEWSLRTWKERHENGYFPNSVEHRDWAVCKNPPPWLMEHGKPNLSDRVLEIGCGYGEWMIPLSPFVKSVDGIDIHESIIRKANNLFREKVCQNCTAYLTDGTTIPFAEDSFSLIYSVSVFQHIPKKMVHGYLAEAYRVCQSGGRALLHFRNADNVGPYPKPADNITENHTGDFSCGWTAEEVLQAGIEAGWNCRVLDIGLFLILIGEKA